MIAGKIIFAFIIFFITACSPYDVDFTWKNMCEHYHRCDIEMPKIIISEESPVNEDGDRILGQYIKATHTVTLFEGHDAETVEHEFAHALGDDLGEKQ